MRMSSPILLKAWFSNPVTGLQFTSLFRGYRKSKEKHARLMNAIDYLVESNLLTKGIHDSRHIVTARKETYLKTPPAVIRANPNLIAAMKYVGVDIDEYEHAYLSSPLPQNMELTKSTITMIFSTDGFIPVAHLFNDTRIEQEMRRRVALRLLGQRTVHGREQYFLLSSTQQMDNGTLCFSQK